MRKPGLPLAGGLRPTDPPPGRLRRSGPPEVWLSYSTVWGLRTGWLSYAPGWPSYAPLWGLCGDLFKKRPKYSKKISFHDFFIRAFKWAANHEKQVFTFLHFFHPYIAISDSPMPRKR